MALSDLCKDFEAFMYGYLDILITTGIISLESRQDCLEIFSACSEMFVNVNSCSCDLPANSVSSKDDYFSYLYDW